MAEKPNVTKVNGDTYMAKILFDDGHQAHFEPYRHGAGYSIEGLSCIALYKGDQLVFKYDVDNNRVVVMEDDYTQEGFITYWKAALKFLSENKNFAIAYDIVSESGVPFSLLQEGRVPVVKN